MSQPPNILLIDDDEQIRKLAGDLLRQDLPDAKIREVDSLAGLRQALAAGGFDIAITDYQLGWTDGLAVLRAVKSRYPDCPVVMFTGTGSEEIAVEAMKAGLDDYVLKSSSEHVVRLSASIRAVLAQAEERRAAREAEARYRSLINDVLDTSAVGLFILDASFRVVWINEAMERYFGIRRADVIGQDKRRLIQERIKSLFDQPDDFAARILQAYKRNNGELRFECHMPGADGREERWLEHRSLPIRTGSYAGGRIEHYYDITERKRAEEALREHEQQLRLFTQATNDLFWNLDMVSGVLTRSIGFTRVFGYTAEEMTQNLQWWEDRLHPDDRERVLSAYHEALAKGDRTCSYEYRFRRRDNSYAVISDRAYIVRDKTGKPIRSLGAMTDISERKRAEEVLRRSVEMFKTIFEQAPMGIALIDSLTGRIYAVNARFAQIAGRTVEEMTRIDWMSITHPDDVQKDLDNMALLNAGTITGFQMEKRYLLPAGAAVWINMTIAPVTVEDKTHPRHLCMIEDITERKRAEITLRTAKDYAENLIQTANAIVIELDQNGNVKVFNQAAENITGYTCKELAGRSWFETVVPRGRFPQVWEVFQRLTSGGLPKNFENPILTKSGEERYIVWQNNEVREQDRIVGSVSFGIDITERKRVENALFRERLRLQSILESASDGIHVLDEAGNVVLANRAFCEMLGYSAEEALRLNVADWEAQWTKEELRVRFVQLTGMQRFETRHRRRDGTLLDVEVSATGLSVDGEKLIYAASRDITVRKALEWKAQEASERMATMIQSSPMAITVLDAEGRVQIWNPAAERIFGWSAEEVLGGPLPTVPEERQDEHREFVTRVLADQAFTGLEVVRRRKDGSPVTISLSAASLRNKEGRITGVMGIMADVTERKQMERYAGRLERLAALGQLLGGIAHEIKNPLFVLTGRLQLLKEKLAAQDYGALPSDLDKIEVAAKRMAHVTERFLTLARPAQLQQARCDIRTILDEMLDFLSNELMKNHIRLVVEMPPDLPAIWSDPRQLQEAFLNLLLNAIQEMASSHGRGTLTVAATLRKGWIEVRIQDDGSGILPEHRPKLFDPFFSTKPAGEGTGLGLWTVRTIVMSLKGQVTCETEVGRGTTFIVRLPAKPSLPPPGAPR
ncbi:MAG: PAS domain S-box protein [Nitrospirae bacterium]|nr:MAG: PAS domain S-box protein [Nitrospirota bacterium]